MNMETVTYFEIMSSPSSSINGSKGNHSFDTAEEAIKEATDFKNDPRSHNPKMSDHSVNYWSNKTYTIRKTVKSVEYIATI